MKAPRGVISLALAIAVLGSFPGALAQEQHNSGLWERLRRAVGKGNGEDVAEPPYSLYGGPVPEARYYSYPYGYPPQPPPPPPTTSESSTTSTRSGKLLTANQDSALYDH